jgi:hypothetical protein
VAILKATCGGEGGGQGKWFIPDPTRCRVRFVDHALQVSLDTLTALFSGTCKVGLFRNDHVPQKKDTIGDYHAPIFPGYLGPQILYNFAPASPAGWRWQSYANELFWTQTGPVPMDLVYGYYVQDALGRLLWAERFCPNPIVMDQTGRQIRLSPQLMTTNEPEEDQ